MSIEYSLTDTSCGDAALAKQRPSEGFSIDTRDVVDERYGEELSLYRSLLISALRRVQKSHNQGVPVVAATNKHVGRWKILDLQPQ